MNDTIYRQNAIDAVKALAVPLNLDVTCEDIWERDRTIDNAIDAMRSLPSAEQKKKKLLFSERKRIISDYNDWCHVFGVLDCAESFLGYLIIMGFINGKENT